jgi:filamentous hemagglutinin family protein
MNHIYRSIWSEAFNTWIAVSELTKGKSKSSKQTKCNSFSYCSKTAKAVLLPPIMLFSMTASALPTGNELVAGQATVATPTATQMQINQSSNRAVINWQGFSVGQNEAVNIQQPNAQAALLNRVVGQDASQIQGKIQANGQVYLVNPNGVLFSKTAQVDVGGLIATTHNISNADFMAGKNHFTQDGAKGTVENHGTINTPNGGVVALIGESVTNTGTINTPKGTTALAAGKTVDLDFQGNGLVEVKVTEAALNAQITNKGAIQADGGRVALTAKAAGQLIDTVINQEGIVQAQGLIERNGEIILDGGNNGTVKVSGTLDTGNPNPGLNANGNINLTGQQIAIQNGAKLNASGKTGGGTITIGDKQITQQTTIEQGATVSAQALDSGKAGTINVLANMDNGLVKVDGLLDASAPNNGDGGFIDTSAAHVKVADTAKISTKATNGNTGTWLIDPKDYTIAASGGDTTGVNLATYLDKNNVEVQTLATGNTGQGDIHVNDSVTWNSTNQLTLTAHRNININAPINAAGGGNVNLRADSLGADTGTVTFSGTGHVTANNSAAVGIYYNPVSYIDTATKSDSTGNPYSSKVTLNSGSTLSAFMLINDVNKLQEMNTNLGGNYALAKDIDASTTVGWNGGAGFMPVGTGGWQQSGSLAFRGKVDGLNHTISNLYINRPTQDNIALFGTVFNPAVIRNVGLVGGSIRGQSSVGSLIGWNENGKVINSYATTEIFGIGNVGGLMGVNSWTGLISNSYATGNVTGSGVGNSVGGLAGHNQGVISNSFATGRVSGGREVGGLVGNNYTNSGRISNSYATGNVSGTTNVGGLVGLNTSATNVSNYWDKQTSGRTTSASGTGLTTAQMKQQASFSGWDFANIWQINQGVSYPTLRVSNTQPAASIITPIVVTTNPNSTPITPPSTTPSQTITPILVSGTPNSTPITTPIVVSGNPSSAPIDTTPSIDVSGNSNSTPLPDKSSNTDVNGNADSIVKTFIGPKQNIEPPNSGLLLITDNKGGKGLLVPPCQSTGSCPEITITESQNLSTLDPEFIEVFRKAFIDNTPDVVLRNVIGFLPSGDQAFYKNVIDIITTGKPVPLESIQRMRVISAKIQQHLSRIEKMYGSNPPREFSRIYEQWLGKKAMFDSGIWDETDSIQKTLRASEAKVWIKNTAAGVDLLGKSLSALETIGYGLDVYQKFASGENVSYAMMDLTTLVEP